MDGGESKTERCQSPEPLLREEQADTITPAPASDIVTNRAVPPGKRSTKSTSISFQGDIPPRRTDTSSSAAQAPRVSLDIPDNTTPRRTETFASVASSVLDTAWVKQYVLSFDGGGIRGYSSLLIIQSLMDIIAELEIDHYRQNHHGNCTVDSHTSYYPLERPPSADIGPRERRKEIEGLLSPRKWLDERRENELDDSQVNNSGVHGPNVGERAQARMKRSRYLPCHYFDYMGGTSTGGLIAIMLSRLRMSIDEAIDAYETLGGYVFGHPRFFSIRPSWRRPIPFPRDKYSSTRFVKAVKKVVQDQASKRAANFGHDLFTSHDMMCKTIVVSFAGQTVEDAGPVEVEAPYLFRSYDHLPHVPREGEITTWVERNPGYSQRIPIWQVARATSAAPTYFDSITIDNRKYGDGGFGANNPIQEIFYEVCHMNGNEKKYIGLLVSIGTGQSKPWSRFGGRSFRKYATYVKAARNLAADSEEAHSGMQRIMGVDRDNRVRYYRFDVPYKTQRKQSTRIKTSPSPSSAVTEHDRPGRKKTKRLGDMKLDEWKPPSRLSRRKCNTTLRDIRAATEAYLSDPKVQENLKNVADELVLNRLSRSNTDYWELASTGTQFRCMVDGCHSVKARKLRPHETNLKSHLKRYHKVSEEELADYVRRGRCPF